MNRKLLIFILAISLLVAVSAAPMVNFCCEKTKNGAFCQNTEEANCDPTLKKAPTSCEATSFCKLGCCYDGKEGTCMVNTPQQNCQRDGGVWDKKTNCEIPQCDLGCCLIGDQAAFVTQARCKKLSSLYGIEIDFRKDIFNEMDCITSVLNDERGACVFTKEFSRTCQMMTRKECSKIKAENGTEFYSGLLCTNNKLSTDCAKTKKTTCLPGKDAVFFLDSCGNIANIYDSVRAEDQTYWNEIKGADESCYPTISNANSRSCGNCDYFLGSTCKKYDRNEDRNAPTYGDNICRDLGCTYKGTRYEHGETWCGLSLGASTSAPGSRYFRLVCYNGEVLIEPCADFRQEICISTTIVDFRVAACRANRWQDCTAQTIKADCENTDRRDCNWIGTTYSASKSTLTCVPKYAPGLNFWGSSTGSAQSVCTSGSTSCITEYRKEGFNDEDCESNCDCSKDTYKTAINSVCTLVGDCGNKANWVGTMGEDAVTLTHGAKTDA